MLQRVEVSEKNLFWMASWWFCAQVWTCEVLSTSQGMGVSKSLYSCPLTFHFIENLPWPNCILPDSDWERNVHRSSDIASWPAKVTKSSRTEKKILYWFFINCSFEICPWLHWYRDCIWQWENFKSHKQFFHKKILLESELFDQDLDPYHSRSL